MTYAILQIAAGAYKDIRDRLTALDERLRPVPSYAFQHIRQHRGEPEHLVFGDVGFEALPEPSPGLVGYIFKVTARTYADLRSRFTTADERSGTTIYSQRHISPATPNHPEAIRFGSTAIEAEAPVEDFTESQRAEIATILETIAKDGLPGPRDLDVALDAIFCTLRP